MNILLIGSGAREHAFARSISQSPACKKLYIAPGNGGTEAWNTDLDIENYPLIVQFCRDAEIQLVVIGPEGPLTGGMADELRAAGIFVLGPGRDGAQLEGSKMYSKAFMERYNIPTAHAKIFTRAEYDDALAYVLAHPLPVVIKADGLAAGKGVTVAVNHQQAMDALEEIFHHNRFGSSGDNILVESFLRGKELSVFVLTDGKSYLVLPEAMDYKRIYDQDQGPNTGGMGAISPVPFVSDAVLQFIETRIIQPTLDGLKTEGIEYRGFIFIGLMVEGESAEVIEYNVRMGDPETEVVFPRIQSDIVPWLYGAASGKLPEDELEVSPRSAVCTVCVSSGYPGSFTEGKIISLPEQVSEDIMLFHAGTRQKNGSLLTAGGRVMTVTAMGDSLAEAAEKSGQMASQVKFEGVFYRKDIGRI